MDRPADAPPDRWRLDAASPLTRALADSLARIAHTRQYHGCRLWSWLCRHSPSLALAATRFPTYGAGRRYRTQRNTTWLAAFWPGLLWQHVAATGDRRSRNAAEALLPSFAARLRERIKLSHDLGFLYLLSARAQWQLTGHPAARELALDAAVELARRYRPTGDYIQAWGPIGDPAESGRFIIDSLMNVPLLWWSAANGGPARHAELAHQHVRTCQRYLVRPDHSTYHTFLLDPQTGAAIGPRTHQGSAGHSLWARGQAWTIYGFTVAGEWTGDDAFLEVAERAADRFLAELPEHGVATWDLRLTPHAPRHLDSSANAIAAGGLLRLAAWRSRQPGHDASAATRRAQATRLLDDVVARCFDRDPRAHGLLRHGNYNTPKNRGVDGYTIFGDYFLVESLLALTGAPCDLWGPDNRQTTQPLDNPTARQL